MTFSINKLKIKISFSFVILITFITLLTQNNNYLFWVISTIIHEFGHIIWMIIFKCPPREIAISIFDIKIVNKSRFTQNNICDIIITSGGPFINFIFYLIFLKINSIFAFVNLCICIFNLLPSASLDGGQILYLILSQKLGYKTIELVIKILTIIIALPLFIFGFLVLINSRYNFSLLTISMYLILTLFLKEEKYL